MSAKQKMTRKLGAAPGYHGRVTAKKATGEPAGTEVSDRWRYVAEKLGSQFYITEIGPGAHGQKTRLFRAPGPKVTFKPDSTLPEKITQAFASAVKSAP
jgi:hypothetical protein